MEQTELLLLLLLVVAVVVVERSSRHLTSERDWARASWKKIFVTLYKMFKTNFGSLTVGFIEPQEAYLEDLGYEWASFIVWGPYCTSICVTYIFYNSGS